MQQIVLCVCVCQDRVCVCVCVCMRVRMCVWYVSKELVGFGVTLRSEAAFASSAPPVQSTGTRWAVDTLL